MCTDSTKLDPVVGSAFFGRFSELRPHQHAAIDHLLGGQDIVLAAATGSGKTEAALAPLLSLHYDEAIQSDAPFLLYVCPTKALINDLHRRLEPPLERVGIRVAIRHGDLNEVDGRRPAQIILTTPESLGILLYQRHPCLSTIKAIIFDEVHLLYNNQRGTMAAILLHRLRRLTRAPIQTAALSATVGDLREVREFIFGSNSNAELLEFHSSREIDGQVLCVQTLGQVASLLARLMEAPDRKLLVFCNSRKDVESVAAELQARPEIKDIVFTHHSSLSVEARESVESNFESLPRAICVSTSTLEMGIDIGDIDAVVLFGPPSSIESLLQRIGRGNRRKNKTNAICLARGGTNQFREVAIFSTMLDLARSRLMPSASAFNLYGSVSQQALSIVLGNSGGFTRAADITDEVAYRKDLDRPCLDEILDGLVANEYLQKHSFLNRYGAVDKLWELKERNLIWGNFPLSSLNVDLYVNGRILGSIPRVNILGLQPGTTFRFGGARYRVASLFDNKLQVEPCSGKGSDFQIRFSSDTPGGLGAFLADALWHWIHHATKATSFMREEIWMGIEEILAAIRATVSKDNLPFHLTDAGWLYFTFAGVSVNRVILSWLDLPVNSATDVSITSPKPIPWDKMPSTCAGLADAARRSFVPSTRQSLFQQQLPASLQAREWMDEWLQDKDAGKVLNRLQASMVCTVDIKLFIPFLPL